MSAAPKVQPQLSELLSWEKIKERYPDQWVFLVDYQLAEPDNEDCCEYSGMRVAACGSSEDEATERASYVQGLYAGTGCRYTGVTHYPFGVVLVRPQYL